MRVQQDEAIAGESVAAAPRRFAAASLARDVTTPFADSVTSGNRTVANVLSSDLRQQTLGPSRATVAQLALQSGAGNHAVASLLASTQDSQREVATPRLRAAPIRALTFFPELTAQSSGGDGRGLSPAGETAVDDRESAALIGGGIGAVAGGVGGFVLGGPVGAVIGAMGGAAVGAGIGALVGGPLAPVPTALRNGPGHTPIDTAGAAGMAIDITLTSSSGLDADMAAVQDSEQVSASLNHTGSYVHIPSERSNNSGYMPGHPIPADRHSEGKARVIDCADNHGGNGSMEREQLDSFTAPAAGITTPTAVPNSGYVIKRIITVTGTAISFRLHKSARAVTVNGFTTAPGPSAAQFDDVVVRP